MECFCIVTKSTVDGTVHRDYRVTQPLFAQLGQDTYLRRTWVATHPIFGAHGSNYTPQRPATPPIRTGLGPPVQA